MTVSGEFFAPAAREAPGTHSVDWMDPRARLIAVAKVVCTSEDRTPALQPVT